MKDAAAELPLILAVDPGCSGAIVALTEYGEFVTGLMMPTMKVGKANRVNAAVVASLVRNLNPTHAFVEQVHAMPKQGVTSTFSFAHATGVVEGVLMGLNVPITHVLPQRWKKHAGLIGSDKDAARSRAIQLYPHLRELDAKGKGQALADAILIGRYGLTLMGEKAA